MSRRGTASRFLAAALGSCWICAQVAAQSPPRAYFSAQLRGEVLDDATAQPLEGAIVVARWNWLDFHPALHGSGYSFSGDAVHVGEALTDRNGRFAIAGWGPVTRAGGKLADNEPSLIAFKPGYEPLERDARAEGAIRLKRFTGAPKDYAAAILRIQGAHPGESPYARAGRGLAWRHESENWKAMPRMILALHREKARLGEDGAGVLGAHTLFGRSGKGAIVDARTREPVRGAVVSIAWTLRRSDATPGALRVVQDIRARSDGSDSQFYVSPWRLPGPAIAGWEVATDAAPMVRVYAPGYRRSAAVRWEEKGGVVAVERLPPGRDALLAELRAWKRDADSALAGGERQAMLALQWPLLSILAQQCKDLTPDLREGICYGEGSDVAAYLPKAYLAQPTDDEEGTRIVRVVAVGSGSARSAVQGVGVSQPGGPGEKPSVSGFAIEPIR